MGHLLAQPIEPSGVNTTRRFRLAEVRRSQWRQSTGSRSQRIAPTSTPFLVLSEKTTSGPTHQPVKPYCHSVEKLLGLSEQRQHKQRRTENSENPRTEETASCPDARDCEPRQHVVVAHLFHAPLFAGRQGRDWPYTGHILTNIIITKSQCPRYICQYKKPPKK